MLEEIQTFIQSPDQGDAVVSVREVSRVVDAADLTLDVCDCDSNEVLATWVIRSEGVRDLVVTDWSGNLTVEPFGHVAIRQHRDPHRAVFFTGRPADPDVVIGRLWNRHRAVVGDWVPFERYMNSLCELRELLIAGAGKICDGPNFLVECYAEVLGQSGVKVSLGDLRPTKVWANGSWQETAADLGMMTIDRSFVVAERFMELRKTG